VLAELERRGASFSTELPSRVGRSQIEVEEALLELLALGKVTADGFSSVRSLVERASGSKTLADLFRFRGLAAPSRRSRRLGPAGRWSLLERPGTSPLEAEPFARLYLRRYGVVFRDLLTRETHAPPWRDLLKVYRRLEARGELRGGRFADGFVGEQFALPEALDALRSLRRSLRDRQGGAPELVRIAATDPLNLVGILTPGARVPAIASNAVLFRNGVPIASKEGGGVLWRIPREDGVEIGADLEYLASPRGAELEAEPPVSLGLMGRA
jgi:ATP-dependent Lhr-like helicase